MIVGLGQCIVDEAGMAVDVTTGEPCSPWAGGSEPVATRPVPRDRQAERAGRQAPPADVSVDRKTAPPAQGGDQVPPVARKPKSTLIKGVPDSYLAIGAAGIFMFMMVLALRR